LILSLSQIVAVSLRQDAVRNPFRQSGMYVKIHASQKTVKRVMPTQTRTKLPGSQALYFGPQT
jgi:hypothetical protein